MANESGKIELAPDVLEPGPEPEASGSLSGDGSGGPPAPRITRFGGGGEGGGGRRERGGGGARDNFFARLGKFFRDTRSEMKRVSWPSLKEVQNTTLITLVAVILVVATILNKVLKRDTLEY